MGRLFPESATLAPEIHSQNTWDKILNRTGVIIKVLFVTSYICHSIRFHLVLFFLQLRFFQIGVQFLVVMSIFYPPPPLDPSPSGLLVRWQGDEFCFLFLSLPLFLVDFWK